MSLLLPILRPLIRAPDYAVFDRGGGLLAPDKLFAALKWWKADDDASDIITGTTFTSMADLGTGGVKLDGANSPNAKSAKINGHRCVGFSETVLSFMQSHASLGVTQPVTYAMIFRQRRGASSGTDRFMLCQDGGGGMSLTYTDGGTPSLRMNAGGGGTISADAPDYHHNISVVAHFDGANSFMTVNGGPKVGLGTDVGSAGAAVTNFGLHPGAATSGNSNGYHLEYMFAPGTIGDSVLAQLHDYLRYRMGAVQPTDPGTILGALLRDWYCADDPDTKFAVSAPTQFVQTFDLASGAGDSLSGNASGSSGNPTIAGAPINGHRSWDFAADNTQFMNTSSAAHPGVGALPFYLFGIIRPRAHATLNQQRNWFGAQSGARIFTLDNGSGVTLGMYNGGASDAEVTGLVNGGVYAFTALFDAALLTLKVHGLVTNTNSGVGTDMFLEGIIGTNGAFIPNTSAEGAALEFGFADGKPSAGQDAAIMSYMVDRAGI